MVYYHLRALLIVAVTLVLLVLIFKSDISPWVAIATMLVLIILIMVIGGVATQIAPVLQAVKSIIQQIFPGR